MPAPPPDREDLGPRPSPSAQGSALTHDAESALEKGLVVTEESLALSAVETAPEGRRRARLSLGAWFAIAWVVFVILFAVLAKLGALPLDRPTQSFAACARKGPFAEEGTAPGHLLGCDSNGRDMASRLAYGAWYSLSVATGAVLLGFLVGGILGLLAGYFGHTLDTLVTSVFNVLLSVPAVVLALALVAFLRDPEAPSNPNAWFPSEVRVLILAIGIVAVPLLGRITRASALQWSQREFVLASRAQGARNTRIMIREVLPNVLPAMFSIALLGIAIAIVAEGTLAILGAGVRPPTPSWGNIIAFDRNQLRSSPHIIFEPAILIFLTVLSLNVLGDVVRARLEVRESGI